MEKIIKTLNIVNLVSALLAIVLCVFPYGKPQNITLYVFFISFGLEFLLEKKWRDFKWTRYSWMYAAFLTFFAMILLWMPFEEHTDYTVKIIEYRLPFLAFGVIGLFGLNKFHKMKYYAFTFITWSVAMILYILFYKMGLYHLSYDGTALIPFDEYKFDGFMYMINDIKPSQYFAAIRTFSFTSHFIFDFVLNLGLISCFYLILRNPLKRKWQRVAAYVFIGISFVILFTTLLFSDGRSGFISGMTTTAIGLLFLMWRKSRVTTIVTACVIGVLGILIIPKHQKFKDKNINNDPRAIIWKHSIKLIKEKPLLGYGAGDASYAIMDELSASQEVQEKLQFEELVREHLKERRILCAHSHSQVFQTTLEYGLWGPIVLLIIIFLPFFIVKQSELKCIATMFVVITFIQLATDIYVSAVPLMPYSLFIIVLLREDWLQTFANTNLQSANK